MPRRKPEGYVLGIHRGQYVVYWYEGGHRLRRALSTADAGTARARLAEFAAIRERSSRPERPTVGHLMSMYIADRTPRVRSPGAITNAWKALAPFFRDLYPEHITQASCEAYQRARTAQKTKSPNPKAKPRFVKLGTVRQELGVLRSGMNWSAKKDLIVKAPFVWRPPVQKPRERHLSRDEFAALLGAARMPHVRLYMLLGVHTIGRMAALLGLTWDRVDFDRGIVDLTVSKQDRMKGRAIVPMTATLRAALAEAYKGATSVYVIEWGGRKVGSVKKAFREACARAGISGVTPHTLRHTGCVWLARAGIPMEDIARYAGHKDPATTRKNYVHFSPDWLADAARALEGA